MTPDCGCTAADVLFSAIVGGCVALGLAVALVLAVTGGMDGWRR